MDAEGRRHDAWWKPVVDTNLTEPRWVRAIEIRPSTVKGRRITHHVIARLQQRETEPLAQIHRLIATASRSPALFMEWAVGKQGEIMRPNSGKLMLPGSKIVFDIHYSQGGEDITDTVELGIYFYPKGAGAEVPPGAAPDGRTSGTGVSALGTALDLPPNTSTRIEGYFLLRENGRIRAISRTCICAARR